MNVMPYQIYRHFKGGYYLIVSVALEESDPDGEPIVVYMSLNGDSKVWTRKLNDFQSVVPEEKFNPTGQERRFELVKSFHNQLSMATTKSLIEELKTRKDNPLIDMDYESFESKVLSREYIVGDLQTRFITEGNTLDSLVPTITADTYEEVHKFLENHPDRVNSRTKIVKAVYVVLESFD